MNDSERAEIFDRLRTFVDQQRGAEDLADRGSLDRAADIMALYDDRDDNGRRRWALELEPPKTRRIRGRPVDPESFSRFTKWLGTQVPIKGAHAYRLRDAYDLTTNYFSAGEINPTGEFALRPLKWLVKNDHADAVTTVWQQAVVLAGGEAPDSPTVRKALTEWKHEHVPRQQRTTSSAPAGPAAVRLEFERLARQLMEQDPEQFLLGFDHIEAMASKRFSKADAA